MPDAPPPSTADDAPAGARQGLAAALRYRDYALLWSGQTVSLIGNGMFSVALPLEVFKLTDSPFDLALVIAARVVPMVLLVLAGGAVVDRLDRRSVMLVSDAVCGACVGAVALLVSLGLVHLWTLAVLSVIFGIASAFFNPASMAITPDILPKEIFVSASSLTSLSQSTASNLLGPLLGGLIVAATGTSWAFAIDAISFGVSVSTLAAMRRVERAPSEAATSLVAQIGEGLRYVRSITWLWWSLLAVGLANLVCFAPTSILEPLLVRHVFHRGAISLGVLYASAGVGGVVASFLAVRFPATKRRVVAIWSSWAVGSAAAIGVGVAPSLWIAVLIAGFMWCGVTYGNILWYPLMQNQVPSELLGRASSVDWALSMSLGPLGILAGGGVAAALGVRFTYIAGGVLALATTAVLLNPEVRDPGRRARLAEAAVGDAAAPAPAGPASESAQR